MGKLDKRFRIYSRLLRLYPAAYQKQYKEQTLQTLEDMLDDTPSPKSKAAIWAHTAIDFPVSLTRQQLSYIGGFMRAETTPSYVKRNAIIGAALLAPFFLTILSGILHNPTVSNTHSWIVVFTVFLIVLPALAFVLNALTFLKWSSDRTRQTKTGFWKNVSDTRRNWQTLATAGLGLVIVLFVFGHDSVHCVTGNPYTEVKNLHQTWQCIQRG